MIVEAMALLKFNLDANAFLLDVIWPYLPMLELIGSVMVSSLLLPNCGTLSDLLFFLLTSTFLPSKSRSITTLGTR